MVFTFADLQSGGVKALIGEGTPAQVTAARVLVTRSPVLVGAVDALLVNHAADRAEVLGILRDQAEAARLYAEAVAQALALLEGTPSSVLVVKDGLGHEH